MSNRQGLILLSGLIMLGVSGTARAASAIKAYSMLTHDGRRLVSHVEGTNTVFELVHTNALPANLPPVREWTIYAVKSAHTDIGLHNSQYIQRHGTVRRIDEARRLIAADPDDSDPAAFRYVAEGAWFWGNYPLDRGEAEAMSVVTNEVPNGIPYRVARYEDLGLPTHSRHEYRIRKVWKDGRKDPLGEPFWGLTRAMSEESRK